MYKAHRLSVSTLTLLGALASSALSQNNIYTVTGATSGDEFGRSVSGAGDIDGDGVVDFAVGTDQPFGGAGYVQVYSGATGAIILTIPSGFGNVSFGYAVSEAGDLDGDGFGDMLISDPDFMIGGMQSGFAGVFSGATGALLLNIPSPFPGLPGQPTGWGMSLDLMGDIDGDTLPDYLVGAPLSDRQALATQPAWAMPPSYPVQLECRYRDTSSPVPYAAMRLAARSPTPGT
jgi:hypothetical protein